MKKIVGLSICILASILSGFRPESKPAAIQQADVCIYGGTASGVIAAYTAKKMGKTVILIEPGEHLGGMTSGGLGQTDIGNKYAITGLSLDFYRRLGKHYGKFEQWIFEPHAAKKQLQQYLDEAGIKVTYNRRIVSARKSKQAITSIILENSEKPGPADQLQINARMFIDCSYEGDLMAKAGVSYVVGREANADFNETYNGVQVMEGHQLPHGIDPYKVPGKPGSGLLWGVSGEKLVPAGSGDKKVQAYNYRICLTSDPANRIDITRPENYDSTRFELLVRLMQKQPDRTSLHDYFIWSGMPNNKTDINNRNGFSSDMIGMNHAYPDADYATRGKIIKEHEVYTKGLLYFMGHDPRVPQDLRESMLKWGYPKDEYVETGHWSPQLYIREARRMVGELVMTQAHCQGREIVKDGVGMAAYQMDSHNIQRLVVDGQARNEGNVEIGPLWPYPVSYRAIIPKEKECTNLLVPVCLSATHIAYGSIRMEPVFMVLGQSAAAAAVMAIDAKLPVQQVDTQKLIAKLAADPLATGQIQQVVVDNESKGNVKVTGNWQSGKRGSYGPSLLLSDSTGKTVQTVRFTPAVPATGTYTVYYYFPKQPGLSSKYPLTFFDGKTSKDVSLKTSDIVVVGQTSGEWVPIGTYTLSKGNAAYVEVSTKGADGQILADAVMLVPQSN
ncbi:FAD-dependent oxidoreductase [Dyadobacter sandarakinus]|uniref:FAD-dependent oxidoreductase n=1 Tax=Dyadobacter sandarakinus TaxID=2747268 RepID=A0ABX7IBE2_9BACT|nr:FAD-dependent oxidoreductase [Dyadobacter sandarakinus]QRR03254.1 FAD-dependent oxidoreductase [Dyadobacter sandarakinus]